MKLALAALLVLALAAAALLLLAPELLTDRASGDPGGPAGRPAEATAASRGRAPTSQGEDGSGPTSSAIIRGLVHDPRGRGIASASIRTIPKASAGEHAAEGPVATTDDSGAFELEATGGTCFVVCAEAAGFSPRIADGVRGGEFVDLELAPAAMLEGLVVDADSKPIAGASISFFAALGPIEVERKARSDSEGAWKIADVPSGADAVILSATAPGFAPYVLQDLWQTTLEGRVRVTIVMRSGGTLAGRVVDAVTGAPLPDARVRITRDLDSFRAAKRSASKRVRAIAETTTDAAGAFRLSQVPEPDRFDHLVAWASAPGHAPASQELASLRDAQESRAEFRLVPAGSVRGRVVDPRGRPVAGVRVALNAWSWFGGIDVTATGEPAGVLSAADGSYRLTDVPSGPTGVALSAKKETGQRGGGSLESVPVVAGEETVAPDLVVKLFPAAVVRVCDPDDRPIAGAVVLVTEWETAQWTTGADGRVLVSFTRDPAQALGALAFVRVTAGGFVDVEPPAFAAEWESVPEVVVKLARASELRCRVRWSDGSDAAGILVTLAKGELPIASLWPLRNEVAVGVPDDQVLGTLETDARGLCRFQGVPAGPWHVAAWREARDAEPAVRVASVTDSSREVVLSIDDESPKPPEAPETADVDVKVLEEGSGRPILDADVMVDGVQALPIAPGVYRRARVPRAPIVVAAWGKDHPKPVRKGVDLRIRGNERVELRFVSGIVVRGRARLPAGFTGVGATLGASTVGGAGGLYRSTTLTQSGDFELRGVPRGIEFDLLIQTSSRGNFDLVNLVTRPFAPFRTPDGAGDVALGEIEFMVGAHVVVQILERREGRPSLQPWDLSMRAADGSWNRVWNVTGRSFYAWMPAGDVTARCEVPGADPVVRSFTIADDNSPVAFTLR